MVNTALAAISSGARAKLDEIKSPTLIGETSSSRSHRSFYDLDIPDRKDPIDRPTGEISSALSRSNERTN
jgi:hypothetical protein